MTNLITVLSAVRGMIPAPTVVHLMEAKLSEPPKLSDFPYVVLRLTPGQRMSGDDTGDTLSDEVESVRYTLRVTHAATSPTSLSGLISRTRDALDRKKPAIIGAAYMRQTELVEPDIDRSVTINSMHPHYAIDEYLITVSF